MKEREADRQTRRRNSRKKQETRQRGQRERAMGEDAEKDPGCLGALLHTAHT